MNKNFIILLILSLGVGIYFLIFYKSPSDIEVNELNLKNESGAEISVDNTKPRIYSFFQTWCSDCVRETPILVSFTKENNVDLYLITDEDSAKVKKYKSRYEFEFDVYYSDKSMKEIGIQKYPTILLFNGSELVNSKLEAISQEDLDQFSHTISS